MNGEEQIITPEPELFTGEMGNFKILNPVDYTDENGVHFGSLEVGSIQHMPLILGDALVEKGDAEKVESAPAETAVEESAEVL